MATWLCWMAGAGFICILAGYGLGYMASYMNPIDETVGRKDNPPSTKGEA